MLFTPWLRSLKFTSRLTHTARRNRRASRLRTTYPHWAAESLEDRTLLSVIWDGGGGDFNWNNALNWSTDVLPGAADDVVIADVLPDITIIHSSGTTSIKSLTSAEALSISGGTFEIAAASSISADLRLDGGKVIGSGDLTVAGTLSLGAAGAAVISPSRGRRLSTAQRGSADSVRILKVERLTISER